MAVSVAVFDVGDTPVDDRVESPEGTIMIDSLSELPEVLERV